eukprot:682316-Amorphochlora_amoeboformis.AAC.3
MDTFEKQFEELDIQSAVMEDSVKQANANAIKEDQVENLMRQVADEHNLKLEDDMLDVPEKKMQVCGMVRDLGRRGENGLVGGGMKKR